MKNALLTEDRDTVFACLATASLGNLIMFVAGLGYSQGALAVMYVNLED